MSQMFCCGDGSVHLLRQGSTRKRRGIVMLAGRFFGSPRGDEI